MFPFTYDVSDSVVNLETSKGSSEPLNHSSKDGLINTKVKKNTDAQSRAAIYKQQTIELLGGDAFLSQNAFDLPFVGASGYDHWQLTSMAVRIAMRMTPSSERTRDGLFPSILIDAVNHCIEERRRSSVRLYPRVTETELKGAVQIMRSRAVLKMGEFRL